MSATKRIWQTPTLVDLTSMKSVTQGGDEPRSYEVHCTQPSELYSVYFSDYFPNTSDGIRDAFCAL